MLNLLQQMKKFRLERIGNVKKKIEKGSEEWQFWQDFYKFRQQYYEADNEDKWWENTIREANSFCKKYAKTDIAQFAKEMIVAHINDVDRRARMVKQNE